MLRDIPTKELIEELSKRQEVKIYRVNQARGIRLA